MLHEINEKIIKLEDEGKKIIKLNIGDPDVLTPHEIVEAAYNAIKQGKTKYSSSLGEKNLREKLASIHEVSIDNVVITPGSKWGIFSVMYSLLKDGGNVIIPTPYWTAYELTARSIGAEPRFLRTDFESNWKIDSGKLENLIDQKTRIIILNSPNNPTSKIIIDEVLDEIVEIAKRKEVTILSDEVYSDISFVKTKSILEHGGNHVLVNSFSKTFAMTGWRVGYVVAKKELTQKIVKLNQITFSNVPVFIQEAALKGLDLGSKIIEKNRKKYRERAKSACEILSGTNLKFSKPDAPFYIFPKHNGLDSEKFALTMLDKGVAIAPGTAFGDYKEHFRISLTASRVEVELGLKMICEELK